MMREELQLGTDYAPPRSDLERRLVAVWQGALGVFPIGLDDDFFELGGDSVSASGLTSALSDELGVELQPGILLGCSTPRLIAAMLNGPASIEQLPSNVLPYNRTGDLPPLFLVHGAAGITFLRPPFLEGVGPSRPVFVFQAKGYDGSCEPLGRLEDIAAGYLRSMLEVAPNGPWNIAGFCGGGWIVSEMAHQMRREGLYPDKLVLIDPSVPLGLRRAYKIRRTGIGRLAAGALGHFHQPLEAAALEVGRRFQFLFTTGHFVNGYRPEALNIPAVRAYLLSKVKRRKRRGVAARTEKLADAEGLLDRALVKKGAGREDFEKVYMSEAAAWTSLKLQVAFRAYRPRPLDLPVDIICSSERVARQTDPGHPLGEMFAERRIHIGGETHEEAVMSPRTAGLVRAILDGATIPA